MKSFKPAYIHTEVRPAVPLIMMPPLTPDYPYPRIGVGVLRGSRPSTQAHLYAHVQHIVVDLEEPRSLRPTIGWPASGAMHHPAYQLRGIHLPHTEVKIASVAAPFFMASGWPGKGHGSLG